MSEGLKELINSGITRGLIIRQPHIGKILDGVKLWEMRSSATKIRGRIALIEAGSGTIVGECNLTACRAKLHSSDRRLMQAFHNVDDLTVLEKWCHPWVLVDVKRYDKPIPYTHPQGAVIWVNLNK